MSPQNKPSIVFCHGLWADGACFNKVMGPLRVDGFEVIASEHGLDSHQGDVDCVIRCVGRVSSPVILVGHSYGGSLITAAGTSHVPMLSHPELVLDVIREAAGAVQDPAAAVV